MQISARQARVLKEGNGFLTPLLDCLFRDVTEVRPHFTPQSSSTQSVVEEAATKKRSKNNTPWFFYRYAFIVYRIEEGGLRAASERITVFHSLG